MTREKIDEGLVCYPWLTLTVCVGLLAHTFQQALPFG